MLADYPLAFLNDRTVVSDDPSTPTWLDLVGLHLGGRRGVEQTRWEDLVGLRILGPRFSGRWWSIVQVVMELVAPVQLRSVQTRVEYETLRHGWRYAEVVPVNRSRFAYRHLDAVEALVEALDDHDRLALLGDAPFMREALTVLPRNTSLSTPRTHRRVAEAIRLLLADQRA